MINFTSRYSELQSSLIITHLSIKSTFFIIKTFFLNIRQKTHTNKDIYRKAATIKRLNCCEHREAYLNIYSYINLIYATFFTKVGSVKNKIVCFELRKEKRKAYLVVVKSTYLAF